MALPRRHTPPPDPDQRAGQAGAVPDWRARYEIENPAEVDAYVAEHPAVVSVLERASTEITARFGPGTTLTLERVVDLDDEPASDFLALDIRTPLDDDEAYARRTRLDEE
jgi:hypothetical protein